MNIMFSKNSIHISGKPAEVLKVISNLSKVYATLSDLLSSVQLNASLHLEGKFPCEDTGSTRCEKEFEIFLDCPPHCSDINSITLKSFQRRQSGFGDNDMMFS